MGSSHGSRLGPWLLAGRQWSNSEVVIEFLGAWSLSPATAPAPGQLSFGCLLSRLASLLEFLVPGRQPKNILAWELLRMLLPARTLLNGAFQLRQRKVDGC